MEWRSIELLNGRGSAARWKDAHGNALVEAALTNGAVDWPGTNLSPTRTNSEMGLSVVSADA